MRERSILSLVGCRLAWVVALLVLVSTAPAHADFSFITNFAKTANDQANLQSSFPVGSYTTSNSFATTFNIVTNAAGKNYCEIALGTPLVISNMNLQNVSVVYALMNAYSAQPGAIASVEFIGSAGADQTFTLSGGTDLRDFYNGAFQNTINGTTTQNAYTINGVVGAAGTGNSGTGLTGTYRLDEVEFVLTNAFLSQTLTTIKISNLSGSCTPIVIGVTAQQVNPGLLFSETFTNLTYKSGWTLNSTNPASSNSLNHTNLTLTASYLNGGSDLAGSNNYAAPRLLQPVSPVLDWTIETKFDFNPLVNYQGAGLLLAYTNGPFTADTNFVRMAERGWNLAVPGRNDIRSVGSYVAFTNTTSYLRVKKAGTNYTGWYSVDGTNWILNGTATMTNQWSYVGLFTLSFPVGTAAANSTASFYYFNGTITPPPLSIRATNNQGAVITWPASATGYVLEQNSQPGTLGWLLNTNPVSFVNGSNQVTITAATNNQYFRLIYP